MLCQSVGKCADLSYCSEEGAILHIGEAAQTFGALDSVDVKFTDLSTGRITVLDCDEAGGELSCVLDGFAPIPGHVYKVEVVGNAYGYQFFPVQVSPFEFNAGAMDITSTAYDHILVRFVKSHNTAGIDQTGDQWLSLPI